MTFRMPVILTEQSLWIVVNPIPFDMMFAARASMMMLNDEWAVGNLDSSLNWFLLCVGGVTLGNMIMYTPYLYGVNDYTWLNYRCHVGVIISRTNVTVHTYFESFHARIYRLLRKTKYLLFWSLAYFWFISSYINQLPIKYFTYFEMWICYRWWYTKFADNLSLVTINSLIFPSKKLENIVISLNNHHAYTFSNKIAILVHRVHKRNEKLV